MSSETVIRDRMVVRRSHRKSRLGCLTCKKRRVKCDEKGPPCGQCMSRLIKCEYAKAQPAKTTALEVPGLNGSSGESQVSDGITDWPAACRVLEFELLHQWSTVTYKSKCGSVVSEHHNWQVVVPQLALGHQSLLQGIFAMSALEIAAFTDHDDSVRNRYIDDALDYHNLASCGLRRGLQHITSDNRQALFALSSLLMVMGVAIPRFMTIRGEQCSMLDHIRTYCSLVKGMSLICESNNEVGYVEPLMRAYKPWDAISNQKLEPELQAALCNIADANEVIHGAAQTDSHALELDGLSHHASCQKAIYYLEQEFRKCKDPSTNSYPARWLLRTGPGFMAAILEKEPVTLLMVVTWGVLMEQCSHGVWWLQSFGRKLVEDLSEMIDTSTSENLRAGVRWARKEVGLEDPG